ncbi:hypothetical protein OKW36_004593 [Paraburkholderia sp. MM5482-R1]
MPNDTKPSPGCVAPMPIALVALSPPPARDDHVVAQAEFAREFRQQRAGRRAAFAQRRHLRARHVAGSEQRIGPIAFRDVEPQCAGRVRWIGHLAARQLQAQIVFRQQHAGSPRENLRLVTRDPQQLRRRETGHRQIAGDAVQFRRALGQLRALLVTAHVVPQDRGPQHAVFRVEQHRAVHLPRQADAANPREFVGMTRAQRGERRARAGPPVFGILLGPALVRTRNGERRACGADHAAVGGEQQNFHFGRAEVDA